MSQRIENKSHIVWYRWKRRHVAIYCEWGYDPVEDEWNCSKDAYYTRKIIINEREEEGAPYYLCEEHIIGQYIDRRYTLASAHDELVPA